MRKILLAVFSLLPSVGHSMGSCGLRATNEVLLDLRNTFELSAFGSPTDPHSVCPRSTFEKALRQKQPFFISQSDDKGVTTSSCMKDFIGSLKSKADLNAQIFDDWQSCMAESDTKPGSHCDEVKTYLKSDILLWTQLARKYLAVGYPQEKGRPSGNDETFPINISLDTFSTLKIKGWDPIDPKSKEFEEVQRETQKMVAEALSENLSSQAEKQSPLRSSKQKTEDIQLKIRQKQSEHLQVYMNIVAAFPLLQYIHSAEPSPAEISEALSLGQKAAKEEQKKISDFSDLLTNQDQMWFKGTQYLQYRPFLNLFLRENRQCCDILAQVAVQSSMQKSADDIILIGVLFLFAKYVPPVLAFRTNLGVGIYSFLESHLETKDIQRSFVSNPGNAKYVEIAKKNLLDAPDDPQKQAAYENALRQYSGTFSFFDVNESANEGLYTKVGTVAGMAAIFIPWQRLVPASVLKRAGNIFRVAQTAAVK